MSNVSQWETSAPNNDAAPPDGAPEGMAANTVNDTMREMMAAVARWYQDTNGSLVTGGAGNAYTLSTNNNHSSLTDLPLVVFVANRANTGAATLNVDGLGAKSLRFGGVALAAGVLQEDVAYIAIYNAEDDAFDIVGSPTRDASQITTGELDDARLSSNVPLKDAENEFSAQVAITGTHATDTRIRRGDTTGILRLLGGTDAGGTTGGHIALFGADYGGARANGADFNAGTGGIARVQALGGTVELNADDIAISGTSVFTAQGHATPAIEVRSNTPGLSLWRSNAPEDSKFWGFQVEASGSLGLVTRDDDRMNSTHALRIFRTGVTIDEIELNATTLDFNGNADISGTLAVGGAVIAGTAATSTSATLAAGQIHHRSENTTVPSMNAGQWVAVQNTSTSSITLSQGSGVTLELGGTTTTGNRTLLAKGFAFIYFRANGVGVVHGSGVT